MKKKINLKGIGKRILTGVIETPTKPILGAVSGLIQPLKDNIASEENGEGNIDYYRLLGQVAVYLLIIGLISGVIDKELFEYLLSVIE